MTKSFSFLTKKHVFYPQNVGMEITFICPYITVKSSLSHFHKDNEIKLLCVIDIK